MNTKPKKLIIFDDDEDILSICSYVLSEKGWEVFAYTDCHEVIGRIAAVDPQVILMDNWIAPEGGICATQLIKQHETFAKIPVVYFSANSDIETLAREAGAEACLPKPFDLETLEEIVNSLAS